MRFINYRSKVVEKGIHSKRMSKKEDIFEEAFRRVIATKNRIKSLF